MFSLTLRPSKTTIRDVTIYEPVDVVALEKLLKSDLLRTTFNNKVAGAIYDSERQQLKAYMELMDGQHAKVTYKKKSAYGRSNPKKGLGLFNIRREVRQTLVKHCMVDIDIQNCHPAILEQVCIRFGVPCDHLTHYNNHRDAILTETMKTHGVDRDTAKRIFIVATYCGNFLLEDQAPSPFYVQFVDQMRRIAQRIADENPDIQSMVRELKEDDHGYVYNFHGKCLSYYLQELEHQILNKTYLFLVQKQVIQGNVCSLQADGIMVRRDHYYPGVLGELTDHVQAELGLQLTFVEKAMEQDYLGSLDDHGVLNVAPRLKRNVEKLTRLPDVVGCHPYASDLCTEDHVLNHSDVILQSCCGTGKTFAVAKALRHLNKTHKIVSVVNRRSLITAQIRHFSHFGIQMNSYLDKENFSLRQHAVVCVNSLMKYKQLEDSDFRNFVLYIDEVQSLCETLTHSQLLLKDVKIVWNVLVRMVKHCHKLVVSDHTITKSVLDLINIRKTPTKASIYIRNTYQKFRDTPGTPGPRRAQVQAADSRQDADQRGVLGGVRLGQGCGGVLLCVEGLHRPGLRSRHQRDPGNCPEGPVGLEGQVHFLLAPNRNRGGLQHRHEPVRVLPHEGRLGASDLWLPNDLPNPEHEGPDVVREGEEGQALPLPEPK